MNEPSKNDDFKTPNELATMETLLAQFSPEDFLDGEEDRSNQLPVRDRLLVHAGISAGKRNANAGHWKVATGVMGILSTVLLATLIGMRSMPTDRAFEWTIATSQPSPPFIETHIDEESVESNPHALLLPQQQLTPQQTVSQTVYDADLSEEYHAFLKRRTVGSVKSVKFIKFIKSIKSIKPNRKDPS